MIGRHNKPAASGADRRADRDAERRSVECSPLLPSGAGRVIGAAGFTPPDVSRKERKARVKAARAAETASRRAGMVQRRAAIEAERRARKVASYLPASGEPGPQSLRAWRRLKIEPHRATSEVLSVAYPFLAEAGLGSDGPLIGYDSWSGAAFVYDPWALYERGVVTNPNGVLAGVIGRGKSTLAKSLATRSIAFGRRVYVPGDPKGEWTVVAKAVGGTAIELGTGNRLNPLDESPRPGGIADGEWRTTVRQHRLALLVSLTEQSLGRPLLPVEHTALGAALDYSVGSAETSGELATLPLVVEALLDPRAGHLGSTVAQLRDDGRQAGHGLGRLVFGDLAGLFDGPSTVGFDPTLPMVSLDLSRISGSATAIAMVMTCASAWMEAALANPDAGPRWVVYDEAWRLLATPALLARMQAQWKLARAYGIANLLVIHRLSDLDAVGDVGSEARGLAEGLLGDCETRIVYRQEHGEDTKTARVLGLSVTERHLLSDLERGEGLWRIGNRAFLVRHCLTEAELELFSTDVRMG